MPMSFHSFYYLESDSFYYLESHSFCYQESPLYQSSHLQLDHPKTLMTNITHFQLDTSNPTRHGPKGPPICNGPKGPTKDTKNT